MDYVWIVKKNADMTEGRGPMLLDSVWTDDETVVAAYIDAQPGVMGRKGVWSKERLGGDWTMTRVAVFSSITQREDIVREKVRQTAMAKLTKEEKAALGLN